MNRFIFDVDGTLTPSRGTIIQEFEHFFESFCMTHSVYLVTGSDRAKTIEQIGPFIYGRCARVYQCAGNDVWEGTSNIRTDTIEVTPEMQSFFNDWLTHSSFQYRTGTHIDVRPGLINFSTIGRGATKPQRAEYVLYDLNTKEREKISAEFNSNFSNIGLCASVAGETGIDITRIGYDKSQIIHDFSPHDSLHFFGDKMNPGGNDYTLALEVANSGGNVYHVKDWNDTWKILKGL